MGRKKKLTTSSVWESKFIKKMGCCHKRNIAVKAKKLVKRVTGVRRNMVIRSEKYNVECKVTLDELFQMAYDCYGGKCKYTGRLLTVDNMVFDHIHPISKGGHSNKNNLQIISKFANTMKGSLTEENFLILLTWLDTLPEELRKDISIRLARGIR